MSIGPNWGGSNFAVSALHPRQPGIDLLHVKPLGIEFLVDPFHHVVMLGVFRTADRLQEIGISPDAAEDFSGRLAAINVLPALQ